MGAKFLMIGCTYLACHYIELWAKYFSNSYATACSPNYTTGLTDHVTYCPFSWFVKSKVGF